jgi:hypothetical protein
MGFVGIGGGLKEELFQEESGSLSLKFPSVQEHVRMN